MLTKRAANAADYDFLYALHKAAMYESISSTWGWDEAWQRNYFDAKFDPARREILLWQGKRIGTLSVQDEGTTLYLALIELLPDFQGRGLGTAIIQELIERTKRQNKDFCLHVLKTNVRARAFYERLGLEVVADEDQKLRMTFASRRTPH